MEAACYNFGKTITKSFAWPYPSCNQCPTRGKQFFIVVFSRGRRVIDLGVRVEGTPGACILVSTSLTRCSLEGPCPRQLLGLPGLSCSGHQGLLQWPVG